MIVVVSYVEANGNARAGRCARHVVQAGVKEASRSRDGLECPCRPVPALGQRPAPVVPDGDAPCRRRARHPGKAAQQRPRIVPRVNPCRPVPAVRQRLPGARLPDRGARTGRRARYVKQEAIAGDGLNAPAAAVPCLGQPRPVPSPFVVPTAVQALAAGQDTPSSESSVVVAFRLAGTDRVTTLAAATGTPGVIGPAAFAGAAPSRPAATSPAAAGASIRSRSPGARNGVLIEPKSAPSTAPGVTSR